MQNNRYENVWEFCFLAFDSLKLLDFQLKSYLILRYSRGVMPVLRLNARLKYCGYW